ncbi:tyrosine-type recombinase/integrase [Clostridium butyricum]|uniref:tyrosine-type recombinase/integrase n=1 Tax=Clostridium butyricum TaxID=1492 RepID=UPI002AAF290F|nr:tyrosine-type recombinase/integrase [Clostridium butyricum]
MRLEYSISYRKKDKGWQCIISYKNNNGKWKQKSKQGFKAQKDSKNYIKETINELERELLNEKEIISNDYTTVTFKQLCDEFIEHSRLYKEHNTVKGYKNAISNFKQLNDNKICNLKKINLTKCIDNMIIKNLNYETIKTYIRRIKLIFDYYKENYNPNYYIDLNFKISKSKKNKDKKALTKKQLDTLLQSDKLLKSKFFIVAYIAVNTGLRCGEILGLTWDSIDEKNMKLIVNKQWKVLKDGHSDFGELKSKNSYRKIPITRGFLKEIKKYRSNSPLTMNKRIAPFNKSSIDKYLNPLLRELAGISLHELRHSYITLLIANGIDFKTVARIAGHDVEQTMATYSHVTDDMMDNASNTISKIFL